MSAFFEDIAIGEEKPLGSHIFTSEDIKRYAARFDPQSFHMDEAAATRSLFGALCASGWHTAMVCARLFAQAHRRETERLQAAGQCVARLGPSPGFRQLKWMKPVYVGDVIAYTSETVEKREDGLLPGFGVVVIRHTGVNQKGEPVISFLSELLVERREP